MKGVIRENLGASRYVVGVTSANQPLADEIQKYQDLYAATIPKVTEAYGQVNELRAEYQEALDVVNGLIADYELCRLEFSLVDCVSTGNAACEAAYLAADDLCLEIESAPGECDADCQRERLRCQERARSARIACLSQVGIDCTEQQQQHLSECQNTWSPQIAAAQETVLSLYPGIQAAMLDLQHELALQWQLAQKLNELEGIQAREHQITCFSAQWNEDLTEGTEVEMAKTPNERFVITSVITAPTPCLHDARVLTSGHLFVNASIAPGSETWRPTWRVGTVKEVLADALTVEFAPANMPGGLGTIETIRPIDCTPPQCYFDGKDPVAAEADIKAARVALKEAQQALLDAVAVRAECLEEYDQTWFNLCYQGKTEACDAIYGDAIEQAEIDKGACYETATSNCETTVNEGLAACSEQFQPAIDEKQLDVDAAQANLTEATNFLIGKQGDLLAAQQALEACLIYPEETPESCAEQYQPAIDAAQIAVDAAYTVALNAQIALNNATESLEAAQKDLKDCQDGFVLADCIANAIQLCDDTYQQAQDTYTQQKAACYQEGLADCDRQRDEAIQACYDANAAAIDAAQATIDDLTRDLDLALAGVYQPANPLILDCPVAHCIPERYQVGDQVLIDFPVRTGSTAMASWDSRRVIGWATETRVCITWHIWYYDVEEQKPGNHAHGLVFVGATWQEDIPDGGSGTEITVENGVDAIYTSAYYAFTRWTDGGTNPTRRELVVTENLNIGAESTWFPFDGNSLIFASVGPDNAVGFISELPEILRNHAGGLPDYEVVYIDDFGWNSEYDEPSILLYYTPPADEPPADVWALLPQSLTRVIGFRHIPSGRTRTYSYAGWIVSGSYHIGQFPGTMTA